MRHTIENKEKLKMKITMKQLTALILLSAFTFSLKAQTDTTITVVKKDTVITTNDKETEEKVVIYGDPVEIIIDESGDTTLIRLGRRTLRVIDKEDGAFIKMEKEEKRKNDKKGLNPHWSGLEFGVNQFRDVDYSIYQGMDVPQDFMDLHHGKSITVNLNILEWAFENEAGNFGLITGMGFSFMDFTFDQPVTLIKAENNGVVMPVSLSSDGLKKTKLNVSYLTAPLMLELKTPLRMGDSHLYLAAGAIGGFNIGSHTKYKYSGDKEKYRSNFNLNSFKYDLTGRIGFGDFCIFVNYGMTPLFKEDKGPGLHPVTVGISFPNI